MSGDAFLPLKIAMKILPNCEIELEKGEPFPFQCPCCGIFIEYADDAPQWFICARCLFQGWQKQFGGHYILKNPIVIENQNEEPC